MAIKFVNGNWVKTCGCGGGRAGDIVVVPANTKAIVFSTSHPKFEQGPVTKAGYSFAPYTISIDVDAKDADEFIRRDVARLPTPSELASYEGRLVGPRK